MKEKKKRKRKPFNLLIKKKRHFNFPIKTIPSIASAVNADAATIDISLAQKPETAESKIHVSKTKKITETSEKIHVATESRELLEQFDFITDLLGSSITFEKELATASKKPIKRRAQQTQQQLRSPSSFSSSSHHEHWFEPRNHKIQPLGWWHELVVWLHEHLDTDVNKRKRKILILCGPCGSGKTTCIYEYIAKTLKASVERAESDKPLETQIRSLMQNQNNKNPSVLFIDPFPYHPSVKDRQFLSLQYVYTNSDSRQILEGTLPILIIECRSSEWNQTFYDTLHKWKKEKYQVCTIFVQAIRDQELMRLCPPIDATCASMANGDICQFMIEGWFCVEKGKAFVLGKRKHSRESQGSATNVNRGLDMFLEATSHPSRFMFANIQLWIESNRNDGVALGFRISDFIASSTHGFTVWTNWDKEERNRRLMINNCYHMIRQQTNHAGKSNMIRQQTNANNGGKSKPEKKEFRKSKSPLLDPAVQILKNGQVWIPQQQASVTPTQRTRKSPFQQVESTLHRASDTGNELKSRQRILKRLESLKVGIDACSTATAALKDVALDEEWGTLAYSWGEYALVSAIQSVELLKQDGYSPQQSLSFSLLLSRLSHQQTALGFRYPKSLSFL